MIERDVVGGAAHLWDCIPSKTMIATGRAMSLTRAIGGHGPRPTSTRGRRRDASPAASSHQGTRCATTRRDCSTSQGVRMINGTGAVHRPAHRRGRRRRRRRDDRVRRRPGLDRVAAAHPRLVRARRRPHPDDPRLLSAEGLPGERHGRRLRCHRRRVRAHVLVVRRQGHARRQPPAGAARQGSRGRRGARGRLHAARREAADGRPGDGDRAPTTTDGDRALRRRPRRRRRRTPCWPSVRSRTPTASGSTRPASRSTAGYVDDQPPLRHATCRTSTPPATSAASCRCRRWRRCRVARSPST